MAQGYYTVAGSTRECPPILTAEQCTAECKRDEHHTHEKVGGVHSFAIPVSRKISGASGVMDKIAADDHRGQLGAKTRQRALSGT